MNTKYTAITALALLFGSASIAHAAVTAPDPGSMLPSSSMDLAWEDESAQEYWLYVGSGPTASDNLFVLCRRP